MNNKLLIIIIFILLGINLFLLNSYIADADNKDLGLYTKAVCNKYENNIECQDAIFLRCNNLEAKLGNLVDARVVFDLDWKDPRE